MVNKVYFLTNRFFLSMLRSDKNLKCVALLVPVLHLFAITHNFMKNISFAPNVRAIAYLKVDFGKVIHVCDYRR